MKNSIFFKDKLEIPEPIFIYILSFLDPKSLHSAGLVNKAWKNTVEKTKEQVSLLPKIRQIPLLKPYSLAQMAISPFSGGLTNRTYKIEVTKHTWVLRIPGKGSSVFINRSDEANNAQQASRLDINVRIEFFDPEQGLQLTRYLENNKAVTQNAFKDPRILQGISHVLRQLHSSKLFLNDIDPFTRNKTLLRELQIKAPSILPPDMDKTADQIQIIELLIKRFRIDKVPCHNDTTMGNFLLSEKNDAPEVKLLDWEYGGNNDLFWDLAYFATDANLSQPQEKELLSGYFAKCDSKLLAWLNLYKPVTTWWNTIWGLTQIVNHADAVAMESYEEYAAHSYQLTQALLFRSDFDFALNLINDEANQITTSESHLVDRKL